MKRWVRLLCLPLCILLLTGCEYSNEISEMAYVVAMGMDVGESAPMRFTFQFAKPLKIAGSGEEEGSGGESESDSSSVVTVQAGDLFTGLNIVNNTLSKQINLSHMKLLVFSREVAEQGVEEILTFLMKNSQTRPSTFVAVAAGEAEAYLKKVKPAMEVNPAKYYSLVFSKKNSNFIPIMTLREMYFHTTAPGQEAALPLVGVSPDVPAKSEEQSQDTAMGNYTAGSPGRVSDNDTEVSGMAVMRSGKLAGFLPSKSVEMYNICINAYQPSYYHIPSDAVEGEHVVLKMHQKKAPKKEVHIEGGVPHITLTVSMRAQLIKCPQEEYGQKDIDGFNRMAEESLKRDLEGFLAQTVACQSDVVGFGRYAKIRFPDYAAWEAYDWPSHYKDAVFTVNTHVNIDNDGLIHDMSGT